MSTAQGEQKRHTIITLMPAHTECWLRVRIIGQVKWATSSCSHAHYKPSPFCIPRVCGFTLCIVASFSCRWSLEGVLTPLGLLLHCEAEKKRIPEVLKWTQSDADTVPRVGCGCGEKKLTPSTPVGIDPHRSYSPK